MDDSQRRSLISKLRMVTVARGATKAEQEAAESRILALEAKMDNPVKRPTPTDKADAFRKLADDISKAARAAEDLRRATRRTGDIFEEAVRQDGRTAAQRNQDMQDRFKNPNRQHMSYEEYTRTYRTKYEMRDEWEKQEREWKERTAPKPEPKCAKPETFYDKGGIPRKRNTYPMACHTCGVNLRAGEGCIAQGLKGEWLAWCCETVPGPRRKRHE